MTTTPKDNLIDEIARAFIVSLNANIAGRRDATDAEIDAVLKRVVEQFPGVPSTVIAAACRRGIEAFSLPGLRTAVTRGNA